MSSDLWPVVRGPAGATWATLADIGWAMPQADVMCCEAETWNFGDTCPVSIVSRAAESLALARMKRWAQRHHMEQHFGDSIPWHLPAKQLVSRKKVAGWSTHHSAVVNTAFTGGYPCQAQLFLEKRVASELCRLCKKQRGSLRHLYYECEADVCLQARAPLDDPLGTGTYRDITQRGGRARDGDPHFERGIIANPMVGPHFPIPADVSTWVFG